jgi:hypothetical protein
MKTPKGNVFRESQMAQEVNQKRKESSAKTILSCKFKPTQSD